MKMPLILSRMLKLHFRHLRKLTEKENKLNQMLSQDKFSDHILICEEKCKLTLWVKAVIVSQLKFRWCLPVQTETTEACSCGRLTSLRPGESSVQNAEDSNGGDGRNVHAKTEETPTTSNNNNRKRSECPRDWPYIWRNASTILPVSAVASQAKDCR